ncbi:MAG: hypothetical protein K8L91_07610, partial [Anaerolineae bacterium]|nr:hypothetical protein [Anaerolineae bacterium]
MLRVLQAAVVLMGGLLLMMTGMVGQARYDTGPLFPVMVQSGVDPAHYLWLEAVTGKRIGVIPHDTYIDEWYPRKQGIFYGGVDQAGRGGVYLWSSVGHQSTFLTHAGGFSVSPDGQWLVATWGRTSVGRGGLGSRLKIMRTDGSQVFFPTQTVEDELGIERNPILSMSPDGEWALFSVYTDPSNTDLYRVRRDGTGLQNLTIHIQGNSEKIVWLTGSNQWVIAVGARLYWVDHPGGTVRPVIPDGEGRQEIIGWLPDARILIVEFGRDYRTYRGVRPDGTIVWELPRAFCSPLSADYEWAFWCQLENQEHVLVRAADGSMRPFKSPFIYLNGILPRHWSPDGQYLLFQVYQGDYGQNELWRFDAKNTEFQLVWATEWILTSEWFPDSSKILAHDLMVGFWCMNADGSEHHRITGKELGTHNIIGWGPTIDRPMNGNALAGIGVLLCSIGMGMTYGAYSRMKKQPHPLAPYPVNGEG